MTMIRSMNQPLAYFSAIPEQNVRVGLKFKKYEGSSVTYEITKVIKPTNGTPPNVKYKSITGSSTRSGTTIANLCANYFEA